MRSVAAIRFVALSMLILLVAPALVRADTFEGKVVAAASGKLTIVEKDGDSQDFNITSDTKITLDGKPCRLADLTAGNRVKVTASVKGEKFTASLVEARTVE